LKNGQKINVHFRKVLQKTGKILNCDHNEKLASQDLLNFEKFVTITFFSFFDLFLGLKYFETFCLKNISKYINMPKNEINYSNTIVYQIRCKDVNILDDYIGHTTNFTKRKNYHKTACKSMSSSLPIYKIITINGGWENWEMVELGVYNCKNSAEAKQMEDLHRLSSKIMRNKSVKNQSILEQSDPPIIGPSEPPSQETLLPQMETLFTPKNPSFLCHHCQFITSNKKDFSRHLTTRKHFLSKDGNTFYPKKSQKTPDWACICKKSFTTRNGLWKHQQKCSEHFLLESEKSQNPSTVVKQDHFYMNEITPELILRVLEQNKELTNVVLEQNKTIMEIARTNQNNINSNNVNSNNKTFNLNVFLNEYCKDAMNIMEFVDSLKLQMSDLETVGRLGFVEGISNIIVRNLQALDIHKRPVHCTDKKREILYVKDEDKWEREDENKNKIRKAIKRVASKNSVLLPEFKAMNPDCSKASSPLSDQFNKLIVESMGGPGDNQREKEDKIIKNISKAITIQRE
jgi:hypothetical protein